MTQGPRHRGRRSLGAAMGEAVVAGVLAGATGLPPLALVVTPAVVGCLRGRGGRVNPTCHTWSLRPYVTM